MADRPEAPVGAEEAATLVAPATGGDGAGVLAGQPVLAVALDEPTAVVAVAAAVASLPAVVVGLLPEGPLPAPVTESLGRFDVVLGTRRSGTRIDPDHPTVVRGADPEELLGRLREGVARSPAASVTLAQLLRAGERLSLVDAVIAESWAYSMLQSGPDHRRWSAGRAPRAPSTSEESVRVTRAGDRLDVVLARPGVRNAVDRRLRDDLHAALVVAVADPTVHTVHLWGEGPSFCSGGDLVEFGSTPDPVTAHLVRTSRSPALSLAAVARRGQPRGQGDRELVVHAHGAAVGAGMEWAAFADRVVARDDARFRLPEVAMGLVPGAGGTASIPRRIGRQRTLWLALTGEVLDAATAREWGLVDEVVDVDTFDASRPGVG
jgi:enoyl-CoA hydratase/carnithine racemase